jgi:hypothetical protein
MTIILIAALIILMGLTLYSLLRGLNAFRHSLDASIDPEGARELQLKQNRMMWARIKYQGLAIAVIFVLLLLVPR